jgi:hypothetical protein
MEGTCPTTAASTRTSSLIHTPGSGVQDMPGRYQIEAGSGLHAEAVTISISVEQPG